MVSAHLSPQRHGHPGIGDLEAMRLGNMGADRDRAGRERVGLSVGGVVLATVACVLGACVGVLPIKFEFSAVATAGCWMVAAVYLVVAARWMQIMLRDDPDPTVKTS
jgi:hypothetical protein